MTSQILAAVSVVVVDGVECVRLSKDPGLSDLEAALLVNQQMPDVMARAMSGDC